MKKYLLLKKNLLFISSKIIFIRLDGVGTTLPGLYTKLDNIDGYGEGEVCMGGRHVFMGYLNAPEKTAEAKDENGWLHSGDLGKIDSNGILSITGKILFLSINTINNHYIIIYIY